MTTVDETPPADSPTAPPVPRTILPLTWAIWFWSQARKVVVFVIGLTVVVLGIVMLVAPGPGVLTIFGGLVILATEFAWARWLLKVARRRAHELVEAARRQVS